ncbi:MAG: sensor histidine kinase N-terminal domain-containing protein [Cyanobacteria bacterium]|nr:sensor histidine kinase N-terminal domain-containing protein [Cyanobacteriota bacterium]
MSSTSRVAQGSIRRRLLGNLIGIVLVTWILTGVISYWDARRELGSLLDAHLAHTASILITLGGDALEKLEKTPQLHRYSHDMSFQIWESGVALREHSLDASRMGRLSPVLEGFSDRTIDGVRWRIFSLQDPQTQRLVQTAERHDGRNRLAGAIATDITLPIAVALPVVGTLLWIGIGRGLRALSAVSRELAARAPDTLTALDVDAAPEEIRPLVDNLNRLFARVDSLLERERRFTADAAHELRTPLAAMRAQAQVAQGAAADEERTRALNGVIAGSDRASRLVDQLLTLARVDQQVEITQTAALDAVLAATVADIAPAARSRNVAIVLTGSGPLPVQGDGALLRILFRNLLENAVRYSPPDTAVHIDAVRRSAHADVVITDEGPGVGAEALQQLGRRFYRPPGTTEPGSGLGLSIATRIAELHQGAITFAAPPTGRGLVVTASFRLSDS